MSGLLSACFPSEKVSKSKNEPTKSKFIIPPLSLKKTVLAKKISGFPFASFRKTTPLSSRSSVAIGITMCWVVTPIN